MSEVYELLTDANTLDLPSLNSFQPELASISSESSSRNLLLHPEHSAIVQSLWRQKGRIDEDLEAYRLTRDKLFNLSNSIKEDSRTRAGRKLEEIASVTELLCEKSLTLKEAVILDVCGAPGAFSFFLLKKFRAEILGFSLKDGIPWFAELGENFRVFFGIDGSGDIYKKENRKSIVTEISDRSCPLIVADGGFEEISDLQELVMARLIFCEVLTALDALSDGGSFLCKLFDVFSEFSRSLLFLLVKVFTRVVVVKPASSRPVNSERYVVCSGYRKCPEVVEHLERLAEVFDGEKFPVSLVPTHFVQGDRKFTESVNVMTVDLALRQTAALKKVFHERDKRKKSKTK